MDIDRGIIKALFYDYPVDELVRLLDNLHDMQYDVYLDILPQLMQWSKPEYTYTEANLLRIQTAEEWQKKSWLPTVYHPFDKLHSVCKQLLTIEKDTPVVRFEQLFRWKETALYTGEDLLTTAFLAYEDTMLPQTKRTQFIWSDILRHNNHVLNNELDKGLTDLHAHYNATADIFSLNWLCLMNTIEQRKMFDSVLKRSQELELIHHQTKSQSTIKQHSVAAAYLRFVFYKQLLDKHVFTLEQQATLIESDYANKVARILTDPWYADDLALKLQNAVSAALATSLPVVRSGKVDYCLYTNPEMVKQLKDDPIGRANMIYQGERELLYSFFYGYYSSDPVCLRMAPYFYLYLLLKSKIRREFVQINLIKGFENFETYQERKDILLPKQSPLRKEYPHYAFYTSVHSPEKDRLEVRVTPNSIQAVRKDIPFDIVVHFIKKGKYDYPPPTLFYHLGKIKDGTRDEAYRHTLRQQANEVLSAFKKNKIVGIDAASSEIFCRPETFGHIYRYAYTHGIHGRTYHVGEDFLDLPDGLRAIDEAVLFLQLDNKCRIGHALALGIDAKAYYERRHYTTTITLQYLLDDCVWLYMRKKELNVPMSENLEKTLEDTARSLYHDIGYHHPWDIQLYWDSMLLRGNDPQYIDLHTRHPRMNIWERTAELVDERLNTAYSSRIAKELFHDYFYDPDIKTKGMRLIQHKWENTEIVEFISHMQEQMRSFIASKKINIECCPTSNLKIGFIDRYDQHPLLNCFYPIDNHPGDILIKSSVNTDDRGVFYTSIYEEYSLIALALYKMHDPKTGKKKYNEPDILRYIHILRKNAQLMAFAHQSQ